MTTSVSSQVGDAVQARSSQPARAKSFVRASASDLGPLLLALVLVAPVVAAGIFYVWTQVGAVRLGFQLSEAGEAHRLLLEENRALRIEVASLKAPERLQRLAGEYGLAPPTSQQLVPVEQGGD